MHLVLLFIWHYHSYTTAKLLYARVRRASKTEQIYYVREKINTDLKSLLANIVYDTLIHDRVPHACSECITAPYLWCVRAAFKTAAYRENYTNMQQFSE